MRATAKAMPDRVFVSRPVPDGPLQRLRAKFNVDVGPANRATTAAELQEGCRHAAGVVSVLSDRIDGSFLDACPQLRVVANFAVGVNNIDLEAARARNVWVTNTPDVLTAATADLAMALILACSRELPARERELREGRWKGWSPLHGIVPDRRVLGIVGMGRIGQAVARRAQAFDLEVLYSSPRPVAPEAFSRPVARLPLSELLAQSDVVSLHCPLTEETRGLLSRDRLFSMKRGALLINTSRGPLVDEAALAEALESGHLGGAGLDVFEREPEINPRLLAAPNALLVPHIGSATASARNGMGELAVQSVIDVLEGRAPAHAVVRPVASREQPG